MRHATMRGIAKDLKELRSKPGGGKGAATTLVSGDMHLFTPDAPTRAFPRVDHDDACIAHIASVARAQ